MNFIDRALGYFGYKKGYSLKDPKDVAELFRMFRNTSSGVSVTDKTALKFSAYFAPIYQRSRAIMVLPKFIMKKDEHGPEPFESHDQYHLLKNNPNSYTTSRQMWLQFEVNRLNKGNGLIWMEGFNTFSGRPFAWHLLDPDYATLDFVAGKPFIHYSGLLPDKRKLPGWIPYREFIHVANDIQNDSDNPLWGEATHKYASEAIGLGIGAEELTGKYIQKNGFLSKYFKHPEKLIGEDRDTLADSLMEYAPGGDREHEIPLFDSGMELIESKINLKEIEPNEMRRFAVEEAARYNLFPSLFKLGHQDNSNYANAYQASIEARDTTTNPDVSPIQAELNKKILLPSEVKNPNIYCHFEQKGLLNADPEMRGKFYKAIGLPLNRVLEIEDMASYGPEADMPTTQVQNIPLKLLEPYWQAMTSKATEDLEPEQARKFINDLITSNNGQAN